MDKDRENLIDDMFEYYDNEDFGNTTVLHPEGNSDDDTQVIDTRKVTSYTDTASPHMEETVQVEIPITRRAPAEETLGNMDREGNIIDPPPQVYVRRVSQNPYDDVDIPRIRRQAEPQKPSRPTSAWYKLKPLWVTIMATFVLMGAFKFYMTDTGIIGTYKRNFSYNMSLIMRAFGLETQQPAEMDEIEAFEEYIGVSEFTGASNPFTDFLSATGLSITAYAETGDAPRYDDNYKKIASLPFSGAGDARFCEYSDGFVCAKPNYICYITKKGDLKWESATSISQPILSVAGKYVAVAGKDSTHLCLYKNGKQLYTVELNDSIKSCNVSEKGDVVLVTEKTAYKGAVVVYNAKGEEVFSWVSGVNYITSATIAKNRSVSVSLVSTENKLTSYVMIFDIYSSDPVGGSELSNTLVYDLTSHKNITYAYGDNSISAVNDDGETKHNVVFDNMEITHASEDENGWRAVSYTDNYLPYMNIYNHNGKLRYSIPTESSPEHIDLYKSIVLYNNGRDVICGKATDGSKTMYRAPMSVRNLMMLNKNTYLVAYENSIELIKI